MERDPHDTKGLIREAFRIDGITLEECRSIFLDWALSLSTGLDPKLSIEAMLGKYAPQNEGHPMLSVLSEGLAKGPQARRRGGRAARVPPA